MALFENFPYTNFHELNLDWIIKQFEEGKISLEEFRTALTEMGEDIESFREYLDNIDAEITEKIETEVPAAIAEEIETGGFNDLISQSHKRRIVFISDSYGQGWTPDGSFSPWPTWIKSYMHLADSDFYNSSEGGAGFGKPSSTGLQYVPNLIQRAYENISNPPTVTDVVMAMGYNDFLYYDNIGQIEQGIESSCAKSLDCFPNARIHIFSIGFTTNKENQFKLAQAYGGYKEASGDFQYFNLSKALANTAYFSSDGVHPLQLGQIAIAITMTRCLNNSIPQFFLGERGSSLLKFTVAPGTLHNQFDGFAQLSMQEGKFYLVNSTFKLVETGTDRINIPGNDAFKLAKLEELADFTGFYLPRPYVWSNGKIYVSTDGVSGFQTFDASFCLAQDQANNDSNVYLWIKLLGTSGSSFVSISNMWRFGVQGMNIELPFITDYKN